MMKDELTLEEAKERFLHIMMKLPNNTKKRFLSYILREWEPEIINCTNKPDLLNNPDLMDDPIYTLNSIVEDIKNMVPFEAILPTEQLRVPLSGENSDCDLESTLHIDEFLYTDDNLDEMVESGQIKRYMCANCGSTNIKSRIFLSHSMARDALYYVFSILLPELEEKTVLDIGSRLGAVLYGAYLYTDAKKIIGVEMNKELCNIQNTIIDKYKMNNRIEVINKRVEEIVSIVNNSDIIILNNPFEFYLSELEQTEIWKFLKTNIRKGTLLVTRPSIDVALKYLSTGIDIGNWLKPYESESLKITNDLYDVVLPSYNHDKFSNIFCYEVI